MKEYRTTGEHHLEFSADMLPGGVYIARVVYNNLATTLPVVLIK